jgi:hypothetical protein
MAENNTDFLDEIVNTDEPTPANDILPEETVKPESPSKGYDPDIIADLERKSKGFYDNMKEERRKRQDIQSELDRVKGTVAAILEMRKQPLPAELSKPSSKFDGFPVRETEDGDLYVPTEHFKSLIDPYESKISALEQRLAQANAQQNVESETQKVLLSIVGEDESYGPAYQKYQAARKWANDQVIAFQKEHGVRAPLASGQALDAVFSDVNIEQDFEKKFPGLNIEDVVQAEDSQRLFRKTLKNISTVMRKSTEHAPDERFKRVLNKPAGLGSSTNAKGSKLSISDKMGDLSSSDIMNLSDDQVKALEKALLAEEKQDGLTFSRY